MSDTPRSLRIVVVSPDPGVLHDLSWMLPAFGYTVVTSSDLSETAAWRQYSETDFVVFDGRSIPVPTPATLAHDSDNPLYRIFLYDPAANMDLAAWFACGAHDALRVPVSRGEVLARLRTGARMLEFENRLRSQATLSGLPGVCSVRGLVRKLGRFTTEGESVSVGHTLLTTAIDLFAGFCRAEGESAGRGLLAALAESIHQSVGDDALAAYAGEGTFHILLPARKVAAARAVAEHIAQSFRIAQGDRASRPRLTLTAAFVPWRVGVGPEQLLQQGQETLAIARQSGGNCALEQHDCAQELANWQNDFAAGGPFANVIAQDIMEPFPAVLQREAASPALLAALRRSGAPVWPLVDREGRLVGVASPAAATDAVAGGGSASSKSPALAQPVTIAHDATFPEICEAFSTQDCLSLIVESDQRPLGYLTASGFLSLIEPIHSATFSRDETAGEDLRGLLVGAALNELEPTSGSDR